MNKRHAAGLVLGMLLLTLGAAEARPWPDSRSRVVVFSDQLNSGMSAAQNAFAAARLAGTQKMLRSDLRAIRAYNANFLCLHYQLALGCGAHNFIVGDEWTSDWSTVNAHEDWFLHNASSLRVHQTTWDWDVMNITYSGATPNTGFPEYWISTVLGRIATNENDGVFADSFTFDGYAFSQCSPSHAWFEDMGLCLANWVPALQAYGAAVHSRFEADGRGFLFLPNLGALITAWDTTDYQRIGDGGMIEGFCFWTDYYDPADWELQLQRITDLGRSNKVLLCQSYLSAADDYQRRLFATASYLLIKGAYAYLCLVADGGLEYFPEYEVNLGAARSDLPANFTSCWNAAWGVYRRDFTNGIVLVNPGTAAVNIPSLGGSYWRVSASGGGAIPASGDYDGSLAYTAVSNLNLAAHSGAILLTATNAPLGPPSSVSASDGAFTDRVRVSWSAVSAATGYEVWRGASADSAAATRLASPGAGTTSYDDLSVTAETTYYYWVKTIGAAGTSAFSAPDSGYAGALGPVISANGLFDAATLTNGAPVTIAVAMVNIDQYLGVEVDWWVVACANSTDWYYLDSSMNWQMFSGDLNFCQPVYAGGLFNLASTPVLTDYVLSAGVYEFWFAVDYPMDGWLNPNGQILFDKVTVTVQ